MLGTVSPKFYLLRNGVGKSRVKKPMFYGRLLTASVVVAVLSFSGCASKPTTQTTRSLVNVPEFYTVKSGESLSSIAQKYNLNYMDVARLNSIQHIDKIYVNQVLRLKASQGVLQNTVKTQPIESNVQIKRETVPTYAVNTPNQQVNSQIGLSQQTISVPSINQTITPLSNLTSGWHLPAKGQILSRFDVAKDQKGIVFGGQVGDAVYAAREGEVVYADSGVTEYGNLVLIRHAQGYITAYAHNSRLLVKTTDRVVAGQKIAEMGSSGSNRVGLQFQIRLDGKPIDPISLLPLN